MSASLSPSASQSKSPSTSLSPSKSASPSASLSISPSGSLSISPSASTSISPSGSASPSASVSPSNSPSPSLGMLAEQVTAGYDPATGKAWLEDVRVLEYTWESAGDDLILRIPASLHEQIFITDVRHLVRTAFAGGTPAIDIGDGTTADFFIAAAGIAETTVNNLARAKLGKKLKANGQVKITLSGSLTAGAGTLFVKMFRWAQT